jgi:O-antigen ligase
VKPTPGNLAIRVGCAVAAALALLTVAHSDQLTVIAQSGLLALCLWSVVDPRAALLCLAGLSPLAAIIGIFPVVHLRGAGLCEALVLMTLAGWLLRRAVGIGQQTAVRVWRPEAAAFGAIVIASAIAQLPAIGLETGAEGPLGGRLLHFVSRDYYAGSATFACLTAAAVFVESLALLAMTESLSRETPAYRARLARMLVVGGTAAGLFNIYRLFEVAVRTGRMWHALPGLAVLGRISMHYDRNAAGSYFAMLLPLAAGLCMASGGRRRQTNVALAIVVAFAAWLTGSRIALAAIASGGLVMAAIVWRRVTSQAVKRAALIAACTVGLVAVAVTLAYPSGRNPSVSNSVRGRTELWIAGLHMIEAHPLAGVGLGRFYELSIDYGRPQLASVLPADNPHENAHNNFLQVGAEVGLPGLLALVWLLWNGVRVLRERDLAASPVGLGAACGALAFVVTWLTGHPLLVPEATYPFFIVFGLALSYGRSAPGGSRPGTLVVAITVLALAATLPLRLGASARDADLDHVGYGMSAWIPDSEVGRFRYAGSTSTVFVPSDAGAIRLPLKRRAGSGPLDVSLTLDGRPANRLVIDDDQWHMVFMQLPPSRARYRRLDLAVAPAGSTSRLLVGKVQIG